jgi:5-oxoprolinase (ATP-hydrolysing) subunit A
LRSIDLNADLGEGFGVWRMGDDDAMLKLVTSANIACGFHAGEPEIMAKSFRAAREAGVAIGAHVSFPDLAGFGRRALAMSPTEIEHVVAYQIGAAQALGRLARHKITYVKAHGALANLAERDAKVAEAIADAVAKVDDSLAVLAIARSAQGPAATKAGLRVAQEIFADRAYAEDGRLAPRREEDAVLHDPQTIVARVLTMLEEGAIVTRSGARLETKIDSICVHGDTPGAVAIAQELRTALDAAGWRVQSFLAP